MDWQQLAICFVLALPLSAKDKLAPDLERLPAQQGVDVIVRFHQPPDNLTLQRFSDHGAVHKDKLDLVKSHVFHVNAGELANLATDSNVEFISPDRPVQSTAFSGGPDDGWMTATGLSSANQTLPYDGSGIAVAIIDSGLDDRDDLKDAAGHNRIVYKQSFVPGDTNTGDKFGHGDHVAGIVGGNGKKSTGNSYDYKIRGIAPNVSLVDLRVLNNTGAATDSTVIAAIQKAIDLKSTYNIRVINLSLGRTYTTSYTSDPLCQAVQQAWAAGIVVVVAAGNLGRDNSYGNNGYGTITAPANRPYLITVGAMNTMLTLSRSDDIVASYSSKGPTQIDHFIVSVRPSAG